MTIASDEVSVVVQGAFDTDFTPYMLAKLRDVLPEAEIILSTWAHPRLDLARFCDAVCVSDDPGGQPVLLQRRRDGARRLIWNNVDRQVVSTRAGLARATRPYAVKMRTDMLLEHAGFLDWFDLFPARDPDVSVLRRRVINNASLCVDPRIGCLGHPSDFFFFGETADVAFLFDIPAYTPRKTPRDVWDRSPVALNRSLFRATRDHIAPEMLIWGPVMRAGSLSVETFWDYDLEREARALALFLHNILPLGDADIGLSAGTHLNAEREEYYRTLDFPEWLRLYREAFPWDATFASSGLAAEQVRLPGSALVDGAKRIVRDKSFRHVWGRLSLVALRIAAEVLAIVSRRRHRTTRAHLKRLCERAARGRRWDRLHRAPKPIIGGRPVALEGHIA